MVKYDPPTSEKAYDGNPSAKLKVSQGAVSPGTTDSMGKVKAVAHGAGDEPGHESAKGVLSKSKKHLEFHDHAGIHRVV